MTNENNDNKELPDFLKPPEIEKFRVNFYCMICRKLFNIFDTQNVMNMTNMAAFVVCKTCFSAKPPFVMEAENELKHLVQMITIHQN